MIDPSEFLENSYRKNLEIVGSDNTVKTNLNRGTKESLDEILSRSESAKGVITVILTSIVYKILNPEQDIRNHQNSIDNGYSGRGFDTRFITPFLASKSFPHMAESGWLTRSLEQKVPYDFNYPGAIKPDSLKESFLHIIDIIQNGKNQEEILSYILQGLIIQRNSQELDLAKPTHLPISLIIRLLDIHFNSKYISEGASRLPVLAIYSIYQCLIEEIKRFSGKTLLPIESHTSADVRSGRIGDIDVLDENNKPFEAVEVKFGIEITLQLVKNTFEKLSTTQVKRYYILSTANIKTDDSESIDQEIERIKNIHGCHLIVNGIKKTLNYYLRLLNDTSVFIDRYVDLLENDTALKFEHKKRWNEIISEL